MAIKPTTSNPSPFGVVGGDLAGFPNGRRVFDDVVSIELKAIAGFTYGLLVAGSYMVDPVVTVGALVVHHAGDPSRYSSSFPYLGTPHDGFDTPSS